jgi:hypothetical protein
VSSILGEWRKGKVRPIPGNAPHDRPVSRRFLTSLKEHLRRSLRRHSIPAAQTTHDIAFSRHGGIYRSDVAKVKVKTQNQSPEMRPTNSRRSAPTPGEERVGRTTPFSSSAMSSGRIFLDRVARQHCPSPLHRRSQNNMHPAEAREKGDISTLPGRGHFYFALTSGTVGPSPVTNNDRISPAAAGLEAVTSEKSEECATAGPDAVITV